MLNVVQIYEGVKHMKETVHNELRSLSHLIYRFIENLPNKEKIDSMTGTNACIIGYLTENVDHDVFQKDIEKAFGITRSTASKVINLMEQKGLVERHSVSCDARLKKIVMTDKSKAISHLMAEDMDLVESVLTDGFSSDEKNAMCDYIKRMKRNLKNYYINENEKEEC